MAGRAGGLLRVAADAPHMPGDDPEADDASSAGRVRLLALLLAGVLLPGLARWWLGTLGHDRLGVAVFVGGYAVALALVWHYWLRGVEFTGPEG